MFISVNIAELTNDFLKTRFAIQNVQEQEINLNNRDMGNFNKIIENIQL